MKQKRKFLIVFALAVLGLAVLHSFWQGVRNIKTDIYFRNLSKCMEIYRRLEGHYPNSFNELSQGSELDDKEKQSINNFLNEIQNNPWHDNYDYTPSTNGFTSIVTGPASLPFGKQRRIERHFAVGEVSK